MKLSSRSGASAFFFILIKLSILCLAASMVASPAFAAPEQKIGEPEWTVPTEISTDDGYAELQWTKPEGVFTELYRIIENGPGDTRESYVDRPELFVYRVEPGRYDFKVAACQKDAEGLPLCGGNSKNLRLTVTEEILTVLQQQESQLMVEALADAVVGGPDQLRPGHWLHRTLVLQPLYRFDDIESCVVKVGINYEIENHWDVEHVEINIRSIDKIEGYEVINLSKAFKGVIVEVDESEGYTKHEKAFISFIYENFLQKTIAIHPVEKLIQCPKAPSKAALNPVLWSFNGAKSAGGMREIFIPPSELGALSDVIKISNGDAWQQCSLYYRFSDGFGSYFEYKVDLNKVPLSLVKKS